VYERTLDMTKQALSDSKAETAATTPIHKEGRLFTNEIDTASQTILLEQYKLYVDSANQTSSLRIQTNTFFLTINTALVGFTSGALGFLTQNFVSWWIISACIAGVLLCISWFFSIRSYRSLNSGRFAVIHELEAQLPARIYQREWQLITAARPKKSKYIRQTHVEQFIPMAFGLLYVSLVIALIFVV
jgi:hypothetical protein